MNQKAYLVTLLLDRRSAWT